MAGIRRFIQNLTRQTEVQTRQAENTPVLRDSSPSSAPTEVTGVPISSLPGASTPGSNDVVPGVQSDTTKKFKLGDLLAWIKTQLSPADIGAVGASDVGVAGGVAELDANGKVPSAQLPAIPSDADEIGYDNTTSGLTATDVQTAIDEVVVDVGGKQPTINANGILKGDGQGGVSAAVAGTDYGTYSKPSGGIPASDLASGVIPSVPSAYASNPEMDGTASPGSSGAWAKGDHVHPHDTSKANQTDLASIHATGSTNTTGARILANKYFYLNGTLVQAITDIPNGVSFTSGTNYEAVVDGGLNNLKTLVGDYIKYVSSNSNANITLPRGNAFIAITLNAYYGIRSCVILSRYISGNSLRIDHIVTDSRHTWTAVDLNTVNVATSYGECQVFFTRIA